MDQQQAVPRLRAGSGSGTTIAWLPSFIPSGRPSCMFAIAASPTSIEAALPAMHNCR